MTLTCPFFAHRLLFAAVAHRTLYEFRIAVVSLSCGRRGKFTLAKRSLSSSRLISSLSATTQNCTPSLLNNSSLRVTSTRPFTAPASTCANTDAHAFTPSSTPTRQTTCLASDEGLLLLHLLLAAAVCVVLVTPVGDASSLPLQRRRRGGG